MKFVYLAEKKCVLYHTEEQDNESLLATSKTNAIGKKIASFFQIFVTVSKLYHTLSV